MKKLLVRNQRGQVAVGFVLTMVVFLAVSMAAAKKLKESQYISQLFSKPWDQLAGMIENGVWGPVNKTQTYHPTRYSRHISLKGDSE